MANKPIQIRKASAGSGKTFQLARQYIINLLSKRDDTGKLVLNDDPREAHSRILAITFTNKATNEMKERIIKELARLAYVDAKGQYAKSDHRDAIRKELNCTEAELQKAAAIALRSLLFSYHNFNVSTIDSFFQLVLRTFAREVDRPGDYRVEIDDKEAINAAVQLMLDRAKRALDDSNPNKKEDKALVGLITRFMESNVEKGNKFNIFNRNSSDLSKIIAAISKLLNEDFKRSKDIQNYLKNPEKLPKFADIVRKKVKPVEQNIVSLAKELRQKIQVYDENGSSTNPRNAIINLASGIFEPLENRTLPKVKGDGKAYFLANFTKSNPALDIYSTIQSYCERIYDEYEKIPYPLLKVIEHDLVNLEFLQAVLTDIEQYRNDNNLILLSDTTDILRSLIGKDDVPFIYEKLGTKLEDFLLDEFQDTSRLQWENLRPLIGNSVSELGSNLIIGDEKQSIYRFRNADYKLLYKGVQDDFKDATDVIDGSNTDNNTNWRSTCDIIEFNNAFFSAYANSYSNSSAAIISDIYKHVEQKVPDKKENEEEPRGLVVMRNILTDENGDELNAEEFRQESLKCLIDDLRKCRKDEYNWGDIAILTSAGWEGDMVIEYLMKYRQDHPEEKLLDDLTVVSEESLLISRADSVRFAVSVLRMLDPTSIENEKSTKEFSSAEIASRYEYMLLQARAEGGKDYDKILSDCLNDNNNDWSATMARNAYGNGQCTSLVTTVEQIISDNVPETIREAEYVYIQAFIDAVIDLSARGITSIHSFLSWWDERGKDTGIELPSGNGINALTVMTIHKSKGLEFPCVIIPFATWEMKKNSDISWFDSKDANSALTAAGLDADIIPPMLPLKNGSGLSNTCFATQFNENEAAAQLDTINKAYVAFTRAKSRLIVTYGSFGKGNNFQQVIGGFLEQVGDPAEKFEDNDGHEHIDYYGDINSKHVKEEMESDQFDKVFDMKPLSDEDVEACCIDKYEAIKVDSTWQLLSSDDDLPNPETAKDKGRILHAVMKAIRTKADLDRLETIIRRRTFRQCLTDEEIKDHADQLRNAISQQEVVRWFEGYSRLISERAIALFETKTRRDGTTYTVLTRRPDRVVVLPDGTVEIIDYKFGERNDEHYSKQVQGYMDYFRKMGYEIVKGYVWYVLDQSDNSILEVK